MQNANSGLLLSAMILAGVWPQTAFAQTVTNAETQDSTDEIIVTASRRDERLRDVPAAVTALSGGDLAERGIQKINDYIRLVPGLAYSDQGPNASQVAIRGIATEAQSLFQSSTVGFYVDDVPIDTGALSRGTVDLRMFDLERLEVLRGPQGTLFGSGTLSGAIRMITNKPDASAVEARAEATAMLLQHGNAGGEVNAMINVPLVTDRAAIRAVGFFTRNPGYVDNIATGKKNQDVGTDYGGRIQVSFDITDRLRLSALVSHQNSDPRNGPRSLYVEPGSNPYVYDNLVPDQFNTRHSIFNFGTAFDLDWAEVVSQTTWQKRRLTSTQDGTGYASFAASLFGDTILFPPALDTSTFGNVFTQELRVTSASREPVRWTLGAFYSNRKAGFTQLLQSEDFQRIAGSPNLLDLGIDLDQTEKALFGEVTVTPLAGLELTAGGRLFRNTLDFVATKSGLFFVNDFTSVTSVGGARVDKGFNPKFSISFKPSDGVNLYATASKGYRTGGVNSTSSPLTGINPTYGSDSLWNYEAGIKAGLFDNRLNIALSAYRIDWSNLQVQLTDPVSGFGYIANAGSAKVEGLEVEATVKASDRVALGTAFSINDPRLGSDQPQLTQPTGAIGAFSGDRLPVTARFTISNFAEVTLPTSFRSYVRLDHQYVGNQYTGFASTGTRYGDYHLVGVRAGASVDGTDITLGVANLLNSRGVTTAFDAIPIAGFTAFPQSAFHVRPRTYSVTLGRSF